LVEIIRVLREPMEPNRDEKVIWAQMGV